MARDLRGTASCTVCKTGPTDQIGFITHILGKRHQKNVRTLKNTNKALSVDEPKRTLYVSGYDPKTPLETLIGIFWKFGIVSVSHHGNYAFLELLNKKFVKEALSVSHYIGEKRLKVSLRRAPTYKSDFSAEIPLSRHLQAALNKSFTSPQNQWLTINMLVNEIELKVSDYENREYLRDHIQQFLRPHFPMAVGHIFGSSANNLGFVGCDVDLYVHLSVDPWAQGTKGEMESKAGDLTWYIARELRRSRVGQKVQAICRARVPIVKFEDSKTRLQVDLSFKHGMPVYNTQLICQYTRAHQLVRPYLMVIRYWGKLQGVAGGGQPGNLITNYGFTMLMLFYLMVREQPLIPSVAELKSQCLVNFRGAHTISGWDCSFGQNIQHWVNRRHNVSVMELVHEFFSYYANFDAKKWVISPLAGHLLDKKCIDQRLLKDLPPCMLAYCNQETKLQTDTALCLQDPFEHCFNITRGLREATLADFQRKCGKAAEISQEIANGEKPLIKLFEDIGMDDDILEMEEGDTSREVDISQDEVITLDDSDDTSQEEIEILNEGVKNSSDAGEKKVLESRISSSTTTASQADITSASTSGTSNLNGQYNDEEDILVTNETKSLEIEIQDGMIDSAIDEIQSQGTEGNDKESDLSVEIISADESEGQAIENGVIEDENNEHHNASSNLTADSPDKKLFKFPLDFSNAREFSVTVDGSVSGGKGIIKSEDDIGQAASSLVHFILQQCLKIDLYSVDSLSNGKKRKCEDTEDLSSSKRIKNPDGDSVQVLMTYRKISEFRCTDETQLWIGRKKISKAVPFIVNSNPLQHEMAVTEAQIARGKIGLSDYSGKLDFNIYVWQKVDVPSQILVTGDSISDKRVTRSMMSPLFMHLTSMTQTLLKKVQSYIVKTSSKR